MDTPSCARMRALPWTCPLRRCHVLSFRRPSRPPRPSLPLTTSASHLHSRAVPGSPPHQLESHDAVNAGLATSRADWPLCVFDHDGLSLKSPTIACLRTAYIYSARISDPAAAETSPGPRCLRRFHGSQRKYAAFPLETRHFCWLPKCRFLPLNRDSALHATSINHPVPTNRDHHDDSELGGSTTSYDAFPWPTAAHVRERLRQTFSDFEPELPTDGAGNL
ncbi:hypothetical protein K438DRAFT_1967563 [Mycena galopus ATCC 62051]|nr:hypothetical protein K438DRAFT_1967563 [Mycena galopus ATCC 62051]